MILTFSDLGDFNQLKLGCCQPLPQSYLELSSSSSFMNMHISLRLFPIMLLWERSLGVLFALSNKSFLLLLFGLVVFSLTHKKMNPVFCNYH